jgi:hypothetical protein
MSAAPATNRWFSHARPGCRLLAERRQRIPGGRGGCSALRIVSVPGSGVQNDHEESDGSDKHLTLRAWVGLWRPGKLPSTVDVAVCVRVLT